MCNDIADIDGLYAYLLDGVFKKFIAHDNDILQALKQFKGAIQTSEDALIFTIPALFEFTTQTYAQNSGRSINTSRSDYLHFRKVLYNNPSNYLMRQQGAYIEVAEAHDQHDLRTYRLVRRT